MIPNVAYGNKLIAQFMGAVESNYGDGSKGIILPKPIGVIQSGYDGVFYHSSWEWLMPVVNRIESYFETESELPRFDINSHHSAFFVDTKEYGIFQCIAGSYLTSPEEVAFNSKIEATWYVAVKFIEWLNSKSAILFLCDICGKRKKGKRYPVFDENWNKQDGLQQCEQCFKEGCGCD